MKHIFCIWILIFVADVHDDEMLIWMLIRFFFSSPMDEYISCITTLHVPGIAEYWMPHSEKKKHGHRENYKVRTLSSGWTRGGWSCEAVV